MWQRPYVNPSVSSLSLDQSEQSDSPNGKITPAVLFPMKPNRHFLVNFWKHKRLCLFCLLIQKHCWNYFDFNQSYLAKGKIAPVVFCLMRQNINTWFYIGGSGLDRTNDFEKFCGSGLDRIQFYRIRNGLGLKNFTVRSSLPVGYEAFLTKCLRGVWSRAVVAGRATENCVARFF